MTGFLSRPWGWVERLIAVTACAVAATLTALLIVTVLDAFASRTDAVQSLQTARELATARINKLNREISHLSEQTTQAQRLTVQLQRLGVVPDRSNCGIKLMV